jgi:MFS family permease
LQVRNYRLFATGQLAKLIGVWMTFTAQDWLVLALSHNSPTALGLVTALQFTPILLLTLYGGKLADRYDKRRLLLIANTGYGIGAMLLAALVATGVIMLWHVFVFAAILGIANSIETPVRQSFVSELVGTRLLPNALSLSAATFNSARIIGPAVAGVAIALMGTGPVFVIAAVATLSPLIGLSRMRSAELFREVPQPGEERVEARIIDGVRYVRARPDLLLPMALMLAIGLAGFNFQVTLSLLAKTVFHAGAASFGLFSTALAVGALGGALAGSGRRSRPSVYVVLGSAVGFGAVETLHDLLRADLQPAGAVGHRCRLPWPGDGPLPAGLPWYQPGRRAAQRLVRRGPRGQGLRLPGWPGLADLRAGRAELAAAPHRGADPVAGPPDAAVLRCPAGGLKTPRDCRRAVFGWSNAAHPVPDSPSVTWFEPEQTVGFRARYSQ